MSLAKTTAILLVAAIFNPICCCLALFANEQAPEPTPAANHSCCIAPQTDERSDVDTQAHASEDCPHSFEKVSQISQSADHFECQAKANLPLVALLPAFEFLSPAPDEQLALRRLDRVDLRPSRPPISQTCCVYLL